MTVHYRLAYHAMFKGEMDIINVYYGKNDVAHNITPTMARAWLSYIMGSTIQWFKDDVVWDRVDISHWEGPDDGVWWELVPEPPHPKPYAPWSAQTVVPITPFAGTHDVGDSLPPQVAAFVYGKTDTKHVIARKFYGPLIPDVQVDGIIEPAALSDFQALAGRWLLGLQDGSAHNLTSEVWGHKYGFQPISSTWADDVLSTNRRRKVGRGS